MSELHSNTHVKAAVGLSTTCASCKQSASQACSGCKNAPGLTENTFYCDFACQEKHYFEHKKVCKGLQLRATLYRAGLVLQEVFYVYREKLFDCDIPKIEQKNGKIIIHDTETPNHLAEWNVMHRFPAELLQNKEEKLAVTFHQTCDDWIAYLHSLVKILIEDLAQEIKEMNVVLKSPETQIIGVGTDGKADPWKLNHQFIKVTLKHNGGEFALDLAGAQYGYFEPVVPWKEYFDLRVQNITFNFFAGLGDDTRFGFFKEYVTARAGMQNYSGAVIRLNLIGARWLDLELENLMSTKISMPGFLKSSPDEFHIARKVLSESLGAMYENLVKQVKSEVMDGLKRQAGRDPNAAKELAKMRI